MRISPIIYSLFFISITGITVISNSGCAQIGAPTGGPRDSIPPRLVSASPKLNSTNFKGNKITLTFDEYVGLEDVQGNVLVSPLPKINPIVDFKLKTVTVKLKDSLLPNTTYAINFGNAIRDNNEGNPLKNFTYVFSTGNTIDSLQQSGKVIIAETGKADSSLVALLYRNANDSSVRKRKPDYIAKLRGDGSFTFINLSLGTFYGNDIPDIFHHADHLLLAHGVAADIAQGGIRYIVATAAKFYFIPHPGNDIAELCYFVCILSYQVQHEPQRRFFPDAG